MMRIKQKSRCACSRPAGPSQADMQVIGLGTARLSGIKQSRDAYVDVLRTFTTVDVNDWHTASSKAYGINLFASAMSVNAVEQVGPLSGKTIWCLVLESTVVPPRAMEAHERCDQLWVPTQFCLEVCLRNGMDPRKVRLVPYYMKQPARHRMPPVAAGPFTVLVSWDGRSSMNRKFVLGAIRAFQRAWPGADAVQLRLKTRDLSEANAELLREAMGDDGRIHLDNRFVETADDLFDGVHALLHLHRAEGYGRHMIEAMQRGVPVIATGYSGNMDWMTRSNALLVDHTMTETAQQEFQYPQGGRWAEPDVEHAAFQLRYCRDHFMSLEPMLETARRDVFNLASIERSRAHMLCALLVVVGSDQLGGVRQGAGGEQEGGEEVVLHGRGVREWLLQAHDTLLWSAARDLTFEFSYEIHGAP